MLVQAQDVFDVFCFTLCWQALRECFASSKITAAGACENSDGAEASTSRQASGPEWSWDRRQAAVQAACVVTNRDFLEGRPEALQSAFDHAAAVMRLTLGHKDGKTSAAQGKGHNSLP